MVGLAVDSKAWTRHVSEAADLHREDSCRLDRQTALADILGVLDEDLNESRLNRRLDARGLHKETLEMHRKRRLGELIDLEDDLLSSPVANTFRDRQRREHRRQQDGNPGWTTL
ncbi:MAG: hypothetical protein R3C01_02730 [Planctomycetaceae bacterium]